MSEADEAVDYRETQARRDREYREAWARWKREAPYAVRAALRTHGMKDAAVDPKVDPRRRVSREETERMERRLAAAERHDVTPASLLEDKEDGEHEEPAARRREREITVRARHYRLFAMFVGTGCEELDVLKLRGLIMLRFVYPAGLRKFGFTATRAIAAEAGLSRTCMGRDYMPLSEVLAGIEDEDEQLFAAQEGVTVRRLRMRHMGETCEEIVEQSTCLDQFARNLAAHLRRKLPMEIAGLGGTQTEVSRKFNEQRATVSAREIRVVEEPAKKAGVRGFHFLGGTKTDEHRAACAKAQTGNTHRRDATLRRRRAEAEESDCEGI